MKNVGQPERATQNRVLALFRDELGYRYLGDWSDREGNSNVEESLLSAWLTRSGYTPVQINAALYKLRTEAEVAWLRGGVVVIHVERLDSRPPFEKALAYGLGGVLGSRRLNRRKVTRDWKAGAPAGGPSVVKERRAPPHRA